MFADHIRSVLDDIEPKVTLADPAATLAALRQLCLDDFGAVIWSMPHPDYPNISKCLPAMASEEVQQSWTGSSGVVLLGQSLSFVHRVAHRYLSETGTPLQAARILDYGCGYGRMLRLMHWFRNPRFFAGCDPWDRSIGLCRDAGLKCRLDQSEYLPETLPYEANSFDFVFAFSVFSHTSLRATEMALTALRSVIAPDGMLAITIRPIEYWAFAPDLDEAVKKEMENAHRDHGFAFAPHKRKPVDGDITYGDTSMTQAFLAECTKGWRVCGYDHSFDDLYQIIVYLRPEGQ